MSTPFLEVISKMPFGPGAVLGDRIESSKYLSIPPFEPQGIIDQKVNPALAGNSHGRLALKPNSYFWDDFYNLSRSRNCRK